MRTHHQHTGYDRVRGVEIGHKNFKVSFTLKNNPVLTVFKVETSGRGLHHRALDRAHLSRQKEDQSQPKNGAQAN